MRTRSSVLFTTAGAGWMAACAANLFLLGGTQPLRAQEKPAPRSVTFWGVATNPDGRPRTGVAGVTFSLYKQETGGAPLWMETQNVNLDSAGGYTAQIGAAHPEGLPIDLFASGQARWLEIQVDGQTSRRVLLVSVPYALKAVDAETLGGLPASAFALAGASGHTPGASSVESAKPESARPAAVPAASVTGSGTAGTLSVWTGASALGNSAILESGGNVGIGGVSTSGYKFKVSSASGPGILGSVTGSTAIGTKGQNASTSGDTIGVNGLVESDTGIGVFGAAISTSGSPTGVSGNAASLVGIGVYGDSPGPSVLGSTLGVLPAGVWGDTTDSGAGVLGTSDTAAAVAAYNKSSNQAALFAENNSTNSTSIVLATYSENFGGYCDIFVNGNLSCSGSVGGHAFVGPGASREVSLYAVQSPENWFEDTGSGQLHNGAALVAIEPEYAQTVNTGMQYHVFLTPNGDCKGLYVSQKSPGSFEVHELGGGTSSIAFDYRVVARRKGFENIRLGDLTNKIQRGSGSPRKPAARRRAPNPALER
jgi:hypothetical protein